LMTTTVRRERSFESRAGARVVLEDAVLRYRAPAMSVSTLVIHAP
jgi:hypothetical protein